MITTNIENDKEKVFFNLFLKSSIEIKNRYLKDIKDKLVTIEGYSNKLTFKYNIEIKDSKIISEHLYVKKLGSSKFTKYMIRQYNNILYKTSETGRCSNKTNINDNEIALVKIKYLDVYYYNIVDKILNFSNEVTNKYHYEFEFINKYENKLIKKIIFSNYKKIFLINA